MSDDKNKARAFLDRLRANPTLQGLNPLQVEDQLLQFLNVNGAKLYPTLSSPAFFQGKNAQAIFQILYKALKEMTNEQIDSEIDGWISGNINLGFLRHFDYQKDITLLREGMRSLMVKIKDHDLSRRNLTGPFTAISSGILDRYLVKAIERQRYIAFEIRKIQRLKMTPEEMSNFVKFTTLFRPAVTLFIADKQGESGAFQSAGIITPAYGEKVKSNLRSFIPVAPPQLIDSMVNSWISFQENNRLEASSRLAAIFSQRALTYRENQKVDRGAETSDKSWFGISRRNYKYMGFDLDMVVELYTISAENGW